MAHVQKSDVKRAVWVNTAELDFPASTVEWIRSHTVRGRLVGTFGKLKKHAREDAKHAADGAKSAADKAKRAASDKAHDATDMIKAVRAKAKKAAGKKIHVAADKAKAAADNIEPAEA